MSKLTCLLLFYPAIMFSQGGKLSFSKNIFYLPFNSSVEDTLRLVNYSGEHGLKALQFRLNFIHDIKGNNNIEFKDIYKGKDIDLPEWSLQYNIVKNPENSETTIFVLLWNMSTGELPPGNYNDFIRFSYDLNGYREKKFNIQISDVTGSW
ncbi:MAG TPA: hypothetical protein VMT35_14060, partial [Ignavibacteriaceae bacterium]|nr:hypothetical protein [Ignavibacteriaceae bacterium]